MKKKIFIFIIAAVILTGSLTAEQKLSALHKEWLDIVNLIMTKTEKEIFLKLTSEEDRNKFIQLFWSRRDTLPDTSKNEFREEYLQRVATADRLFGRGTGRRGSLTERGYFYLLLGPPLERSEYTTFSQLWPLELWYYGGPSRHGLPPHFYLIFYQPQGVGQFRLYSPSVEGPEKLVTPTPAGRHSTRTKAYKEIKNVAAELASASLSYIPGEAGLGTTSLSTNTLLADVYNLAEKQFSDDYAREFLSFKDYVETDYTDKYIDSRVKLKRFRTAGRDYLHWTLEPGKMNFSFYKGRHYAEFQLIIRLENPQGNPVLEKEENIPLQISPEQYARHERGLFAFQDLLPVIPGDFRIYFLLKNKTGKDFTSFQKRIQIPGPTSHPAMSDLLLYHSQSPLGEGNRRHIKAFSFDGIQYVTNAQNNFLSSENLGIYFQIFNAPDGGDSRPILVTEITAVGESTPSYQKEYPLDSLRLNSGPGINIPLIPLEEIKPDYYTVVIRIQESSGQVIAEQRENFVLLSQNYPVLPWVYARLHTPAPNPGHLYLLASQYFLSGQYGSTEKILEEALRIQPDTPFLLLQAKTDYAQKRYAEALTAAFPLYEKEKIREAGKIMAASHFGMKDWKSAIGILEELLEAASEISVLNLAAECYLRLDSPEKALPLIENSLSLDPRQEGMLKLREEALRRLKNPEGKSIEKKCQ